MMVRPLKFYVVRTHDWPPTFTIVHGRAEAKRYHKVPTGFRSKERAEQYADYLRRHVR